VNPLKRTVEEEAAAGDAAFDPLSRRRFLAGLVTTTVGVTGIAGAGDAIAAVSGDKSGTKRIGPRLGKDGLPLLSVEGTYIGADGDAVLIGVDNGRVVRVLVTPNTMVTAHGRRAFGDVSAVKAGDVINVGTQFDYQGTRMATWMVANLYASVAVVESVRHDSFEFRPAYDDERGTWECRALLTDYTQVHAPGPEKGLDALKRGDYIHFVGTMPAPTMSYDKPMWASAINKGDPSKA
jgi:hypothetical protein